MTSDKQLLEAAARAAARIGELEAALKPFADFYSCLVERRSVRGYQQDAYPNHTPVVTGAYPAEDGKSHVCQLYVSDFKRAALCDPHQKGESQS